LDHKSLQFFELQSIRRIDFRRFEILGIQDKCPPPMIRRWKIPIVDTTGPGNR